MSKGIWTRSDACRVVGEVGQAHDGSLGTAHAFIDAIADAGADAVKFQTHIARAESTTVEPWRVRFSPQDASRYDYWKRMEFSEEQWRGLRKHAEERGLLFLSSPFSIEAIELLSRVGVAAWKVASGEIGHTGMFDLMAETGLPILISTGMSPLSEIDQAIERAHARRLEVTVLQCTSAYPCPPEHLGLNLIPFFRDRYECDVGLSDHSGTIYGGIAAATLGARVIEVHVCFSRRAFGPDVAASLSIDELAELVRGVRFIESALAHPVDKDSIAEDMGEMRTLFTRSVVTRTDLPAGRVLSPGDLALKRPGTGIPRFDEVIGRRLRRALGADSIIVQEDLE